MKVDPVFSEAVHMLFGDAVDPREAWANVSKMDDTSEVHVPGNNRIVKKPKKKPAAEIAKAFEADVAMVVSERFRGNISTGQALDAIEAIEKAYSLSNIKPAAKKAVAAYKQHQASFKAIPAANAANLPHARRVLSRTKAVVGLSAAGAGGYKLGQNNARKTQPVAPVGKSFETTWTGEISKVDGDKRQVFGWCSLSEVNGEPVVDLQGDYVPIDAIESSAYKYVLTSRKGGDMHERDGEVPLHTSDLIESFVVTPDKLEKMGLPGDSLPLGWWVGFKVNDDKQWDMVKKNERTGFSIHGKGSRAEKVL